MEPSSSPTSYYILHTSCIAIAIAVAIAVATSWESIARHLLEKRSSLALNSHQCRHIRTYVSRACHHNVTQLLWDRYSQKSEEEVASSFYKTSRRLSWYQYAYEYVPTVRPTFLLQLLLMRYIFHADVLRIEAVSFGTFL